MLCCAREAIVECLGTKGAGRTARVRRGLSPRRESKAAGLAARLKPCPFKTAPAEGLLAPGRSFGCRGGSCFCVGSRRLRLLGDRSQTEGLADLGLELLADIGIFFEEVLGVLTPLPDAVTLVAEPRARLLYQVHVDGQIDQVAFVGNAFAVNDVELGFAEGRGRLVLDDLDLGAIADNLLAVLDRSNAPDVDADRGIELQRAAAGGGLGIAEHH